MKSSLTSVLAARYGLCRQSVAAAMSRLASSSMNSISWREALAFFGNWLVAVRRTAQLNWAEGVCGLVGWPIPS